MGKLIEPEYPKTGIPAARVLFVEDLPELRRAFSRMLRALGYVVVEAEDGAEALELVSKQSFDVVLTDVMMPRMNGIELLRALQARDPNLPVLVVSAVPTSHVAREAAENGAFEYLSKPVEPERLQACVARALGARTSGGCWEPATARCSRAPRIS